MDASRQLLEDEFTGIMERTSIAGDPRVARTVAETHLAVLAEGSQCQGRTLLREAMRRIRRILVLVHFPAHTCPQLRHLLEQVHLDAVQAIIGECWRVRESAGSAAATKLRGTSVEMWTWHPILWNRLDL